jgi:hypothetical protein
MTPVVLKSIIAVAAVAGLGFVSVDTDGADPAYGEARLQSLSMADVEIHAAQLFERADADKDATLNADEYTALAVVTAELARLNGFIVIECGDCMGVVDVPNASPAALSRNEHIRIAAIARNVFYGFAGLDGKMDREEFEKAQIAMFEAADRNNNGRLGRKELSGFAQRQASFSLGV